MYNYDAFNNTATNTAIGMAIGFVIFLSIIVIALAVLMIIAYWVLFKKAGKKGWEAIIPYYNGWILNEISGAHWIWWIVMTVAGAGAGQGLSIQYGDLNVTGGAFSSVCWVAVIISDLVVSLNIAKKFGKSTVFGVFLLVLLPFIGYPILAFGSSKYNDKLETAPHGIFDREFNKKQIKQTKKEK